MELAEVVVPMILRDLLFAEALYIHVVQSMALFGIPMYQLTDIVYRDSIRISRPGYSALECSIQRIDFGQLKGVSGCGKPHMVITRYGNFVQGTCTAYR